MTDKPSDKIKPEDNPWYLLATLHGEAKYRNDEVHARNRTAWNRFMAAELTEHDRALLIQKGRCSAEDLAPFSPEELSEVEKLFSKRYLEATGEGQIAKSVPALPNLKRDRIDFSNIKFHSSFIAEKFLFPMQIKVDFGPFGLVGPPSGLANFRGAIFSGTADFSDATFLGRADFRGATFLWADFKGVIFNHPTLFRPGDWTDFSGATFFGSARFGSATFFGEANFSTATFRQPDFFGVGRADFSDTTFSSGADFSKATFFGEASFSGVTFGKLGFFRAGRADFSGATFSGEANFLGVTFEKESLFVNATMKGLTSFEEAKFISAPPQFFGAKLHEGTVWRGVKWPPPPKDQKEAGPFVAAYERLKLEMDRLKKHEDELDFFALELQSRRVLDGDREQQVSELKVFGCTVFLLPPFKIIFEKIKTLRLRELFGRFSAQPLFARQARTIRLPCTLHGLAIALYGLLSDYGRSYVRPLTGLLITVLVGIPFFWWRLCGFWQAAGHSLANTFGVFGFRRDLIGADVLTALPGLLKVLAAAQTVAGIVLLFLLGVAIRNRFRMK